MTLADGLQIYGAAITTLGILFISIKYLISFRITPLEGDLINLRDENKRLEEENKEYSEELDEVKQALVDEVKDISKGNYEFRLKYENAINEIKLLLAEKYIAKKDLEKELEEIKKQIDHNSRIHYEVKAIRKSIESINGQDKK
jgi:uncharacterized protein YegP (UPF0339 family)